MKGNKQEAIHTLPDTALHEQHDCSSVTSKCGCELEELFYDVLYFRKKNYYKKGGGGGGDSIQFIRNVLMALIFKYSVII